MKEAIVIFMNNHPVIIGFVALGSMVIFSIFVHSKFPHNDDF